MKLRVLTLAAAAALTLPGLASAGLVYDTTIIATGQGFGSAPRDLTLQATGQESFQSGAVNYSASGIGFGTPIADSEVFAGNGVTNQEGTSSMPMPRVDDKKYGVPTTGSLDITTANQIGILFNATEPNGDGINVTDLTLKFYESDGTFIGAIDGSFDFDSTVPGNGGAGFVFVVAADQQSEVNGFLEQGGAGTTLALEASTQSFAGGAETFLIYNLASPPVAAIPEPGTYAMLLAGLGAIGFVARRRRTT
ncbi:MAG TPA: PEP-CTERM sorting domain-containing protein [Rubrivivax sp.]